MNYLDVPFGQGSLECSAVQGIVQFEIIVHLGISLTGKLL